MKEFLIVSGSFLLVVLWLGRYFFVKKDNRHKSGLRIIGMPLWFVTASIIISIIFGVFTVVIK